MSRLMLAPTALVGVVGLGQTGLSCIEFLLSYGFKVVVIDSRAEPPGLATLQARWPQLPKQLGSLAGPLLDKAEALIVSPGLAMSEPALQAAAQRGVPLLGDIELFAHYASAPIIGITGSNAKGTVTSLVDLMIRCAGLQSAVGGNIGIPALTLLKQAVPDFYVLELSSFQLETTHHLPLVAATVLNLSPDHLDRYASMADYAQAKQRIYQQAQFKIYNRDDTATFPQDNSLQPAYSFGLSADSPGFGIIAVAKQSYLAQGNQALLPVQQLKIKGRHNWANALAALALGHAINLPLPAMLSALTAFSGLPHRCQWLREYQGVNWYNDSKGTNVGATIAAIEGLGDSAAKRIILLAGGVGKGADFSKLRPAVGRYVKAVFLFGQDGPLLAEALAGCAELYSVRDLAAAVAGAAASAGAGDQVLLSPACASLDMFTHFEHRGDVFTDLVRSLGA